MNEEKEITMDEQIAQEDASLPVSEVSTSSENDIKTASFMERLLKDKRNIWYLCGMLAGVAAIIVGISFLKRQFYGSSDLDRYTFGADFYTEIYNASRRIYGMLSHINDFIEYVKKGFGFTFILAGVVDICVFGSKIKIAKKETVEEISDGE